MLTLLHLVVLAVACSDLTILLVSAFLALRSMCDAVRDVFRRC